MRYKDEIVKHILKFNVRTCRFCLYTLEYEPGKKVRRCPYCRRRYKKPTRLQRDVIQLALKKVPYFSLMDIQKITGVQVHDSYEILKRLGLSSKTRVGFMEYPVVYKGYTAPALNFLYRIRALDGIDTLIERYPQAVFYGKEQLGYW